MSKTHLLYRWDAESGRMRLEATDIPLGEAVRLQFEQKLRDQYARLLARLDGNNQAVIVQFEGVSETSWLPVSFHVSYAGAARSRNPTLSLTPVENGHVLPAACKAPQADGDALDGQTRGELLLEESEAVERTLALNRSLARHRTLRPWIGGLLQDLEARFAASNRDGLSKWDRASLGFSVGEFRTLCRERPDDLAVILLAGWVALCETNSQGGDSEEAALYTLASRSLEQLFAQSQGWDEPLGASAELQRVKRADGTLSRISRMLARLLGLDDF